MAVRDQVDGLQGVVVGGGFDVLGAALYGVGVPRSHIIQYEKAIAEDKIMLVVHAKRRDVERAGGILHGDTQQVAVHVAR